MADRFQALEQAFHFGFVFGAQERIARRGKLAALGAGRKEFAPELLIRDTVDEGVLGTAAEVAEQALAGIDVSGVEEQHPTVATESQANDKRRNPGSPVEPQYLVPGDDLLSDGEVMLVDLDGWLKSEEDEECRTGYK